MELTGEQHEVVEAPAPFVVEGPAGSGKTTALRQRYLRWATAPGASTGRILFVARSRALASRVRHDLLPELHGGFDALPVTTAWALAVDIVTRHDGPVALLGRADHRALIADLLQAEAGDGDLWPSLHEFISRPAFVGHAAAALASLDADAATDATVLERATAAGVGDRWHELLRFRERVNEVCHRSRAFEVHGLVRHALSLLDDNPTRATTQQRFDAVLVDDADALPPVAVALLDAIAGDIGLVASTTAPRTPPPEPITIHLTQSFRTPAAGELIECRHPSMEPEAIAAELLAGRGRGLRWSEMAVLAASADTATIGRALARHAIPTEPARRWIHLVDGSLREVVARLRESGRAGAAMVSAAHKAFADVFAELVRPPAQTTSAVDDRVLDDAVAFLRDLDAFARVHPRATIDAYIASREGELVVDEGTVAIAFADDATTGEEDPDGVGGDGGVTVSTVGAAGGREWPLVVLAGCVEGVLPRVHSSASFFDGALTSGPRPAPVERHREALERERARFRAGATRATTTLLATAAPEPGVLISRFVEGWPRRAARLALDAPPRPATLTRSQGVAPVWPDGVLRLSATQLDTYEDCPLKYALRYAAGVRTEAGLHADLGSVVHDALARFLDPTAPGPITRERMLAVADECWRDDIAPYRPQVEEARRDYYDMLELWWEGEGVEIASGAIEVLATEYPFDIEVGPHRVTGKIDRIDRVGGASGTGVLRVLDYKTGKSKPRKEDVAANVQLATYHLAALRDETVAAWGRPRALRLLYLRSMSTYEQDIADDHEAATEARILEAATAIVAEQFDAAVTADCDHCELHRLCPLWPEGLEIGQA